MSESIAEISALVQNENQNSSTPEPQQAGAEDPRNCPISEADIKIALRDGEDGDAWLLTRLLKGKYIYDHAASRWSEFAEHYWREDTCNNIISEIQEVISIYLFHAQRQSWLGTKARSEKRKDDAKEHEEFRAQILGRIDKLHSVARKKNVLYLAASGPNSLAHDGSGWDSDPWLLGFRNGVFDLKSETFRDGRPEDYISKICNTEFRGLNEPILNWKRCLGEIFDYSEVIIAYIQRYFGYCLTGSVQDHIFTIWYGPEGRNGKTTVIQAVKNVLGPLAGTIPIEMLLAQKISRSSAAPSPDVMSLRGLRCAWSSEPNKKRALDIGRIKLLSGGDYLTGRELYGKRPVNFPPTHKIILLANHRPTCTAGDPALWERVSLIPFTQRFVDRPVKNNEHKRDPELPEKLLLESPGIMGWLIKGFQEWKRQGLNPPEEVRFATEEYKKDQDDLLRFIEDCCVKGDNQSVKASQLFKIYSEWCDQFKNYKESSKSFYQYFKSHFHNDRLAHGVHYFGLDLNEEWKLVLEKLEGKNGDL